MTSRKRLVFSYCCLALLLAMLFAVSLFWGSVALTPQAVLAALTGRGQDALSVGIITQLRLPRAVMAVLLGAALSAAGYLLQTFFANPIAGPFVMGISSGAKNCRNVAGRLCGRWRDRARRFEQSAHFVRAKRFKQGNFR